MQEETRRSILSSKTKEAQLFLEDQKKIISFSENKDQVSIKFDNSIFFIKKYLTIFRYSLQ
jgi:hypothetical protein